MQDGFQSVEKYGSDGSSLDVESQQREDQILDRFDSGDDADWLALSRDAYETSTTYFDANIRRQIEKNISLYRSKHPAGSKYHNETYKFRSKVFRPKTRASIRRHEAAATLAFFSTQDMVSCSAENHNDEKSVAGAKIGKNWLDFRLEHSIRWFQTLIGAYNDAMINGIVISRQEWIYEEEETKEKIPKIENGLVVINDDGSPITTTISRYEIKKDTPDIVLIPIENFRFSTAADWRDPVGTSPFLIEMIPMFVQDVLERANSVNSKTGEAKWKNVDDDTLLSARQTGDYDTTRLVREGKREDPKDQTHKVKMFDVVWVHRNIVRKGGTDYMYYTLGTEFLLSDPVPLEDVFLHGRPYVVGSTLIEPHRNYPSGLPELTQELQVEANDLANQRLDNIKLILNKRYRAKRGSNVDWRALKTSVPGGIILMDDLNDVVPEEFSDVTGSAYQEQDRVNVDFDEIIGQFSMGSVQTNRSLNETVGGMNIAADDSSAIVEYQLRVFTETWVENVLRQLIRMGQKYETDEKVLSVVGGDVTIEDDKAPSTPPPDPNAPPVPPEAPKPMKPQEISELMDEAYSVRIAIGYGATSPHKRIEKLTLGLATIAQFMPDQLQSLKGNAIKQEIFGALGYRDGSRFFEEKQDANPEMAQLQQQVQELTQIIESKKAEKEAEGQVKLQIAQMKEQGDMQRMQMKLAADGQLSQLTTQINYIQQQIAAEKNDIARGQLILQQDALEFKKRDRELELLAADNDKMSGVLMRDDYGMVPAAEG